MNFAQLIASYHLSLLLFISVIYYYQFCIFIYLLYYISFIFILFIIQAELYVDDNTEYLDDLLTVSALYGGSGGGGPQLLQPVVEKSVLVSESVGHDVLHHLLYITHQLWLQAVTKITI